MTDKKILWHPKHPARSATFPLCLNITDNIKKSQERDIRIAYIISIFFYIIFTPVAIPGFILLKVVDFFVIRINKIRDRRIS